MLKVLYLSTMAFDANLSLIKRLDKKCDITYLFELRTDKANRLGIFTPPIGADIIPATELLELKPFSKYLPLAKTFIINSCRFSKIFTLLRKQISLWNFIKKLSPDIIHCGDELSPVFFLFLLLTKHKVLLTVHDPIQHSGEDSWQKKIIRKISFRKSSNFILLNKAQVEEFKDKYKIVDSSVHLSALSIYEFLQDYPLLKLNTVVENNFNILFFGRISAYKGINYLLEAFVKLQLAGYDNITLTIAGGGAFSFDTSEYENNTKISIINRFISSEELANLIHNSSVVVCPYIDATQSGVVMSAFALNKPVIATNVGGLPEMVEDGKTGLIIEPQDSIVLKEAIESLYNNPDLLIKMKNKINLEYRYGVKSWNYIADQLIEVYHQVSLKKN